MKNILLILMCLSIIISCDSSKKPIKKGGKPNGQAKLSKNIKFIKNIQENSKQIVTNETKKTKSTKYKSVLHKHKALISRIEFELLDEQGIKDLIQMLLNEGSFEEINKILVEYRLEDNLNYKDDVLALYSNLIEKAENEEQIRIAKSNYLTTLVNYLQKGVVKNKKDISKKVENYYKNLATTDKNITFNEIVTKDQMARLLGQVYILNNESLDKIINIRTGIEDLYEKNKDIVPKNWNSFEYVFYYDINNYVRAHPNVKCSKQTKQKIKQFLEKPQKGFENNFKYPNLRKLIEKDK